jgi:hypothetical protein
MGQLALERQLIGTTGNVSSQGSLSLSASTGEPFVTYLVNGSLSLSQGFQQADGMPVGVDEPLLELKYDVYPNPTAGKVIIDISTDKPLKLGVEVFDLNGQSCGISSEPIWIQDKHAFELDLTSLSDANYFLVLQQEGKNIKAIQIQKIN